MTTPRPSNPTFVYIYEIGKDWDTVEYGHYLRFQLIGEFPNSYLLTLAILRAKIET
jgi:hypothetical protein